MAISILRKLVRYLFKSRVEFKELSDEEKAKRAVMLDHFRKNNPKKNGE